MSGAPPSQFARWRHDFFEDYYRRRPVNAAFVGMHGHDVRLPDLSAAGLDALHAATDSLAGRLTALPDDADDHGQQSPN